MKKISLNRQGFYVRTRTTGECYLAERINRNTKEKYRWTKNKDDATILPTYDIAQKCRRRYGGRLVRATIISVEELVK